MTRFDFDPIRNRNRTGECNGVVSRVSPDGTVRLVNWTPAPEPAPVQAPEFTCECDVPDSERRNYIVTTIYPDDPNTGAVARYCDPCADMAKTDQAVTSVELVDGDAVDFSMGIDDGAEWRQFIKDNPPCPGCGNHDCDGENFDCRFYRDAAEGEG